jgi:hypothetical protein
MPSNNNTSSDFDGDDWDFDPEEGEEAPKPMMLETGLAALDFTEAPAAAPSQQRRAGGRVAEGRVVESRLFSSLTADAEPLVPLPPDTMTDVDYQRRFEPRCALCNAPEHLRTRAEHIYLEDPARKPQSVVNFFAKYYAARITHQCVAEHMKRHCFLDHLYRDGLQALAQEEESAMIWKYRELDLSLTSLVRQLGRIEGMDCRTKDDLNKQNAALMAIHDRLMKLRKDRDDSAIYGINPFESLARLLEKMPTKETKKLVADEARYLRELLSKGQDV